jgi:hypothetical protein
MLGTRCYRNAGEGVPRITVGHPPHTLLFARYLPGYWWAIRRFMMFSGGS